MESNYMLQLFLTLGLTFIVLLVIYSFIVGQGKKLKSKFDCFDNLIGKSKDEIFDFVGDCTTTIRDNDNKICVWNKGEYSMTLTFDANDKVIDVKEVNRGFLS